MEEFLKFNKTEQKLWLDNLKKYDEVVTITSESWSDFVAARYFTDVSRDALPVMAYKTQADVALYCALNSVLRQHMGQAMAQVRFAIENLSIAVGYIYDYDGMTKIYDEQGMNEAAPLNEAVRKVAYKAMEDKHADENQKVLNLKKAVLNIYGSHQSVSILGTNFSVNDDTNKFTMSMFDDQPPFFFEMAIGIVGSVIHLFNSMFVQAVSEDDRYLKIDLAASNRIIQQKKRMDVIRARMQAEHGDILEKNNE